MKKFFAVFLAVCIVFCGFSAVAETGTVAVRRYASAGDIGILANGEIPTKAEAEVPLRVYAAGNTSADLENLIYDGLNNRSEDIDVSKFGITLNNIYTTLVPYFSKVVNENGCFFDTVSFSYSYYPDGTVPSISPIFKMDDAQYAAALQEFNAAIKKITAGIDSTFSDLEKVVYVHDYFVTHYQYDLRIYIEGQQADAVSDAYQFFVQKRGVCQAYTLAFTAVMRSLGIESTSALDDPDNHTWNVVKLGNQYYHVDCTWDDPVYDTVGRVMHNNLLLSDTGIEMTGHTVWYFPGTSVTCTDTSYEDAIWKDSNASLQFSNGSWYMLSAGENNMRDTQYGYLTVLDRNFGVTDVRLLTAGLWLEGQSFWQGFYSGLSEIHGLLYGNTYNTLWTFDPSSDEVEMQAVTLEDGIFASNYIGGGILEYVISANPNDAGLAEIKQYRLFYPGDADGDGVVSASDLVDARQFLLYNAIGETNWFIFDLNEDGEVDIADYVRMKKTAAGVA